MLLSIYVCLNRVLLARDAIFLSAWVIHCLWWEWQANASFKKAGFVAILSTALRSAWFSLSFDYRFIGNIIISFLIIYV